MTVRLIFGFLFRIKHWKKHQTLGGFEWFLNSNYSQHSGFRTAVINFNQQLQIFFSQQSVPHFSEHAALQQSLTHIRAKDHGTKTKGFRGEIWEQVEGT